ncbi:MAG: hypothetical protein LLG13_05375 [Bacteroidales bacterium]|nr:hypothetical protein [Bacteroidales bacterium]
MVSTNNVASWPMVPKPELLGKIALKSDGKIALSDDPKMAKEPWFILGPNGVIEACIT